MGFFWRWLLEITFANSRGGILFRMNAANPGLQILELMTINNEQDYNTSFSTSKYV